MSSDLDPPVLDQPAGSTERWTLTFVDADEAGIDYSADPPTVGLVLWAGDDRAALTLASSSIEWDDEAEGTATLTIHGDDTAALAPGDYRGQATLTLGGAVTRRDFILRLTSSPGSSAALATYHAHDEQLRFSPWIRDLEGLSHRAGFEEERHEARAALEELAHARDPRSDYRISEYRPGTHAGGWASTFGGHHRSERLQEWLDDDRLVVTADVRAWLCHFTAGLIARRQVGPGADESYMRLAAWHEAEAGRRGALLLIGIDTTTEADGVADYWIDCGEVRVARG